MPKIKTKKSLFKRIKLSKSGLIKRRRAYTSHLAQNKTTKQKKHLSKGTTMKSSDVKRLQKLIN